MVIMVAMVMVVMVVMVVVVVMVVAVVAVNRTGKTIPQYRSYYTHGRGACWLRPAAPKAKLTWSLDFHGHL